MRSLTHRHVRALGAAVLLLFASTGPLLWAQPKPPMQQFVLLFRKGPKPLNEVDLARRQAAIRDWARAQQAAGHKPEPRNLAADSAQPGLAAPPEAVGQWPLVALVFIEAGSFADASAIAAQHPAKDFDTSVEVRPWSAPTVSLVSIRATGIFEVNMKPADVAPAAPGRFLLDKHYHGDLEASAAGEMLTGMTTVPGSAGYVAIEQVTGTLAGRSGTFLLQHTGTMNRGSPALTIAVIPDSGTGNLVGLSGTMEIQVGADGAHSYIFNYVLPGNP